MNPRDVAAAFSMLIACTSATPARAQGSRLEIGAAAVTESVDPNPDRSEATLSPGIGLRLTYGVARRLSLQARIDWFPRHEPIRFEWQGGRTTHASVGARGILFDGSRLAVAGFLLPGIIHFTQTDIGFSRVIVTTADGPKEVLTNAVGSSTHFALDFGVGVSTRLTDRVSLTGDYMLSVFGFSGSTSGRHPGKTELVIIKPSEVRNTPRISAGLTYRLGVARRPSSQYQREHRWEVGGQIASLSFAGTYTEAYHREPGIALFASRELAPYLEFDAAINAFPRRMPTTDLDGGRRADGLAGVKVGTRHGRIGTFAKLRVGASRYTRVLKAVDDDNTQFTYGTRGDVLLDLGGVIEIYPTRRLVIRVDGGDTSSFHRVGDFLLNGMRVSLPGDATHAISLATGVGWRLR
jgi:hypothetical protein